MIRPILAAIILMLHWLDIGSTYLCLNKLKEQKDTWYNAEKNPITRFFVKSLGLKKGIVFLGICTTTFLLILVATSKYLFTFFVFIGILTYVVTHNYGVYRRIKNDNKKK